MILDRAYLLRLAVLLPALVLLAVPLSAQAPRTADAPVRIEVDARRIDFFQASDHDRRQFGALEFRGGLELTAPTKDFGGLSALHVAADGEHFLSLSDKGFWLRGRIVYGNGAPVGIADAEMAPMIGPDGKPLASRGWFDTESLTVDSGMAYVGIERVNQVVRFDYGKDGLLARGQPIPLPAGIAKLPYNKGLECLTSVPKGLPLAGTLIAVSERGLDDKGNLLSFLIGGPNPGDFTVARSDDFDVSDCAVTPSADLLLLERRFSWRRGVAIRIRRVPLANLKPGALVDGPILLDVDMGYQIDNMEGLGIHRAADGRTVLTMISDDNFSPIQRTILLQFTLLEP